MVACGGRRDGPRGLVFPRGNAPPALRVERLVESHGGELGSVRLARLQGTFRVESSGPVLDLPFASGIDLLSDDGDRLRLLVDHPADERILLDAGDRVAVRFFEDSSSPRATRSVSLRDTSGALVFFGAVRPPNAPESPAEERLPPALRPEPGDERVYQEVLRDAAYCTLVLNHIVARLPGAKGWRRLAPGDRAVVTIGERRYAVRLIDHAEVGESSCETYATGLLAYQVFALP